MSLVIVDLEGPHDAALGADVAASLHRGIAPGMPLNVVREDVPSGALRHAAGIVVTGSPSMVHEADWAMPLGKRLLDAAATGVPVLGICFGHQLLAVASGGDIASWTEVRTGVKEVRFDVPDGVAAGPFAGPATARLVHTHRDRVVDGGAMVPVARDEGLAALVHPGLPVWSLQGHPEATPATCRAWNRGLERLGAADLARTDGHRLLAAFGDIVRRTRRLAAD